MSSNTAERWWVRLAARWLARIDGVSGQLRLAMLGLTGVSTASLTLKQFGYGRYAVPFIAVLGVGTIAYTYVYAEGGVWNQVARDRRDLSDNFSGPTMLHQNRIQARQLAHLAYYLEHGTDDVTPSELADEMRDVTNEEWAALRDGVNLSDVEQNA